MHRQREKSENIKCEIVRALDGKLYIKAFSLYHYDLHDIADEIGAIIDHCGGFENAICLSDASFD